MDLEKIKVIGFDLGYTLLFNNREEDYQAYLFSKGLDVSVAKIEEAFHLADKIFFRMFPGVLGKKSETFFPWYIGVVNYQLNVRFDLFEQTDFILNQQGESSWRPFPWTEEVLKGLKELGYRLVLLSNWDLSARHLIEQLGLAPYFDDLLISSELGIEKPDVRIFQELLSRTNSTPEEMLYVGDNYYDDVIGAEKAGIKTVLLNRFGKLGIEEIQGCPIFENTNELFSYIKKERNVMENVASL
ncbi:haloacid dehalogenase [Bacillus sp. V3-13]|uniref:HAD family hydrolase n=1 Tax=Bacillus sp. V3-13 TaxID=2053728 RepID=UPI000C77AAF5|nr:HAD family hydrolase [Bacillus sp. V3-13]PLR75759.1 haloacid dehalogenase [Bacillus sp. V3-13]